MDMAKLPNLGGLFSVLSLYNRGSGGKVVVTSEEEMQAYSGAETEEDGDKK